MLEGLEPFTRRTYGVYLDGALESGYRFIGFADVAKTPPSAEPFVLLRHDIDFDPTCVPPIGRIEAERGIRATYFFQTDSPLYQFKSQETRLAIESILEQGHHLGLHFDANRIADDAEVVAEVERLAASLEADFQTPIAAVSFHMPTYRPIKHLTLAAGRMNTYSPMFFETIEYVSDSNQHWRGKDILKIFQERSFRRIQLLTHPFWWREAYSPLDEKIQALASKLGIPAERIFTPEQLLLLDSAAQVLS
jgi:hypothetical protein